MSERVVYHDGFLPPNVGTGGEELPFGESFTRQSEANDADINVVIRRFVSTGVMPVNTREALFMDVSDVGDFRKVRGHIEHATTFFMSLDAKVREFFRNDPAEFL